MAELLLEKETINHDDLVSLIGARPFKAHKSYLEFISANEDAKQKMADSKEGAEAGADATADADKNKDDDAAANQEEEGSAAAEASGEGGEGKATSKEP